MAKKKKIEHPFTVVYVYAPEQYKADYMAGKTIPRVKIGETYADADDCQTCMEASMKRINQQSTSFEEYNYLLQWFVFPYKEGTDIAIRKILTENIYHLSSSSKIDNVNNLKKKRYGEDKRQTKIGQEFAYRVNIAQVNTAVSAYKLKAKMEELINDKGIDPAFKARLRGIITDMLENLDDVVKESVDFYVEQNDIEDNRIISRKRHRFNFEEDNIDFNY